MNNGGRSNREAFEAFDAAVRFSPYLVRSGLWKKVLVVISGRKGRLQIDARYGYGWGARGGWDCILTSVDENADNDEDPVTATRVTDPPAHASIVFHGARIMAIDVDIEPRTFEPREIYHRVRRRENVDASAARKARAVVRRWRSRVAYERAHRPGGREWALAKQRFEAAQRRMKSNSKSKPSRGSTSGSGGRRKRVKKS